jgi:hypothetical protein
VLKGCAAEFKEMIKMIAGCGMVSAAEEFTKT